VPGREVAPRWARPARRLALRERLPAQLRPEHRHSARRAPLEVCRQPEVARPGDLAAWLAPSSWCPRQAASSAVCRRAAAEPSSGFRRAV